MTRLISLCAALAICACGGPPRPAPATPPPAPATPPPSLAELRPAEQFELGSLVEGARTTTLAADFREASAPVGPEAAVSGRRDLDVAVVVSLVRERLGNVAILAVADTLKSLGVAADRPWARDLLRITAQLATAASTDWRPLAEGGLRVIARIVIADAVVRTRASAFDAGTRELLTDWAYWYLAQIELLRDRVDPPACARPPADLCAQIRDAPGGPRKELERILEVDQILDGARLVGRLRAAHADSRLSATLLLEQLMSAGSIGPSDVVVRDIAALNARLDEMTRLDQELVRFERARQRVQALTRNPDPGEVQAAARALLQQLEHTVTIDGRPVQLRVVAGKLLGDRAAAAYADLFAELQQAKDDGKRGNELIAVMNTTETRTKLEITSAVARISLGLAELRRIVAAHPRLDALRLEQATELLAALHKLLAASRAQQLEGLATLAPGLGAELRKLRDRLQGVAVLLDRLSSLAGLTTGASLSSIHQAIRVLRKAGDRRLSAPVLDVLAPIMDKLAEGRRLTAADVFAAVSDIGPAELMRALGSGFDVDGACREEGSWQCWSVRLAMSVHGSLRFDGKTVAVDTDAVIASLAQLGAKSRKTRPGSFHLLASVGTGTLYVDDAWRPLVAEQLGASMVIRGNDKAALSVGAYASGLLYRFVLDDHISDGVMFGGTVLLRLYDLVELHAGATLLVAPEDLGGHRWHVGAVFGAQVPLGDYLERLRN